MPLKKILDVVFDICFQNFQHFRSTGATKFTEMKE